MRQIVLDTETTGLEVSQGHRIIEIGCVELVSRRPTGRHFHRYLNPEREVDEGAVAVHGLTLAKLSREPRFAEIVHEHREPGARIGTESHRLAQTEQQFGFTAIDLHAEYAVIRRRVRQLRFCARGGIADGDHRVE